MTETKAFRLRILLDLAALPVYTLLAWWVAEDLPHWVRPAILWFGITMAVGYVGLLLLDLAVSLLEKYR